MSECELVTVNSGTLVGVDVVGLGVLPVCVLPVCCGLGCTPGGMNRDGALPMAFEGLYGTDTGRTPGLTGGIPTRHRY